MNNTILNKEKPLFTIITATYNSEKVIMECIKSVAGQTFTNYEHLIIDGNSSDGTVELVKSVNDEKIKFISEPDQGVYDAWNKGLNLTSGTWILFLGSDDILYPNALEKYAELVGSSNFPKDVEFVSSRIHLVNSVGEIYRTYGKPYKWTEFRRSVKIAHTGSLHKRSLFEKYGRFNIAYKICGDYEFLLRVGPSLKAKYIDFVAVAMSDGGISNNRKKVFKEHYRAVTEVGGLNKLIARYDYFLLNLKVIIRGILK